MFNIFKFPLSNASLLIKYPFLSGVCLEGWLSPFWTYHKVQYEKNELFTKFNVRKTDSSQKLNIRKMDFLQKSMSVKRTFHKFQYTDMKSWGGDCKDEQFFIVCALISYC